MDGFAQQLPVYSQFNKVSSQLDMVIHIRMLGKIFIQTAIFANR
jgi:hypothetical protein